MKKALYVSLVLMALAGCDNGDADDKKTVPLPIIQSIEPKSAVAGASVVVKGSNFGSTATDNIVKVGDLTAEITGASSTELKVIVPWDAHTAKVSVSTGGVTGVSTTDFTVEEAKYNIFMFYRNSKGEDLLDSKTTGYLAQSSVDVSWYLNPGVAVLSCAVGKASDPSLPTGNSFLIASNNNSTGLTKYISFPKSLKIDTLKFEYTKAKLEKLFYNSKAISIPNGMTDFPTSFPVVIVK